MNTELTNPYIYNKNTEEEVKELNRLFNQFVARNNIVKKLKNKAWPYIFKGARKVRDYTAYSYKGKIICEGNFRPPGYDHAGLYQTKSGERILVYHPYSISKEQHESLLEWAKELNLIITIFPKNTSFYYPGHTCQVEVIRMPPVDETAFTTIKRLKQEWHRAKNDDPFSP